MPSSFGRRRGPFPGAPPQEGVGGLSELNNDAFEDEDTPKETEYYDRLGLAPRPPPTSAQIRSAYRHLTLTFHPDKQPPHLREAAERAFNQIKVAYDVLSDPHKRTVYDLEGAAAVKREWGLSGIFGPGGEAESDEIGVKAMSPEQFRRWFLKRMEKRNLQALEDHLSCETSLNLGIYAANAMTVDEDDDVQIHIPNPRIVTMGMRTQWRLPCSLLSLLDHWKAETQHDEAQTQDDTAEDSDEEEEDLLPLEIDMGLNGHITYPPTNVTIVGDDNSQQVIQMPGRAVFNARELELGATLTPNFVGLFGTRPAWNRFPLSILTSSEVSVSALLFPAPALNTTLTRTFAPIPGTKPFHMVLTSTINRSLGASPPSFQLQLSRSLAHRKVGAVTWNTGPWQWPEFLTRSVPSMFGMSMTDYLAAYTSGSSSLQLALISYAEAPTRLEHAGNSHESDAPRSPASKNDDVAEAWQTFITAAPQAVSFGMSYSRNVFTGFSTKDLEKAQWNYEGYSPMPMTDEQRPIRIELTCVYNLGGGVAWNVEGSRQVGEHSKIGIGAGIMAGHVNLTISWSRLTQKLKIPVIILPIAHHGAASLATLFPWLSYCALEFGYIRPRDRKRRREANARRHKELKGVIPQKRQESEKAIEMMAEGVIRRQEREAALPDGLVVAKAEYGYYPPTNKKPKAGFTEPRVTDVTIPVASLVDRSQLVIPGNQTKFNIRGFYDPAPLLPKRLKIWYKFQGFDHFVELRDKEGTACPLRAHMISE
ncbi:hypothetical protein N7532_006689 [Penicillium argentinense]|uniref:J domain-containing protein n=1 Tax=Penicillium argentinense TaxID=1131581 RepID=A0A9W9KB54_9EURO|nr:uncharacterized protein N7532_006689 [Penicillium argentinense]KAJ5099688.1 hypothetical protein N7532_006689 [Penicillium argentinense]